MLGISYTKLATQRATGRDREFLLFSESMRILLALPSDALLSILSHVVPEELITAVAPTCCALRDACCDDGLWRLYFHQTFPRLLASLFDGEVPLPPVGMTMREHYFLFPGTFMQLSHSVHGRLVMQIEESIIDATHYLHDHPGEPEVLLAAAGHDATEVFAAIGHSRHARHSILPKLTIGQRSELVPARCERLWSKMRASTAVRGGSMESDAAVTANGDDGCEHLAIEPEDGDSRATTRTSPCSTWLTMVQAVARGMRTVVRLAMDSHLRSMLRLSLSVLVRDLSEGRPDCRRLAPAVFKLAEVRLTATSQSRAAPTSSTPSRTSSPDEPCLRARSNSPVPVGWFPAHL